MCEVLSLETFKTWKVLPQDSKSRLVKVRAGSQIPSFQLSPLAQHCPYGASRYDNTSEGRHTLELEITYCETSVILQGLDEWAAAECSKLYPKTAYRPCIREDTTPRIRLKIDLDSAAFWNTDKTRIEETPSLKGRHMKALIQFQGFWSAGGLCGISLCATDLLLELESDENLCPFECPLVALRLFFSL
jgi:hypothetical protein